MDLDKLEFRSPAIDLDFPRRDGSSLRIPLFFNPTWQKRLRTLWDFVQRRRTPLPIVGVDRDLTQPDTNNLLICTGAITLTLPPVAVAGDSYFIFRLGVLGTITIAGTINGDPAGYQLVNQYQYVEVTSLDGAVWIITAGN